MPWTSAREEEAQRWAERCFGKVPPPCAARVGKVLCECVTDDLEQLTPDAKLAEQPDVTELRRVQLVLALEREFGFSVSDKDAEKMTTPAGIVSYVACHQTETSE